MPKLLVTKEESVLNRAVILSGLIPLLLGILAIIGWLSDIKTLASVKPEYIPMAPDTAILFIVLGIIFFIGFSNHKIIIKYLNTFIISFISIYGLLKFIGYLIDINLTFDDTLFPITEKLGIYPLRHMSPLTGSSFFITGIAILIKIYGKDNLKMLNFIGLLGIAILFNGFTAVLGYIFGNPLLYGSATIPIALTTSVSFCFIGLGITAMSGSNSIFLRHFMGNSPSARMLRIILPIIVFAVLGDNIIYHFLSQEFSISLASLVSVITLILIIITTISVVKISQIIYRNAKIEEEKRKAAEIALQEANEMLEQRVYERTEALQTSEERLRGIFRSSPDGFVVIDTKGNITDCNERLLEIFNNKSKGELLGKNAFSFIIEEDRKRADENWKTVFDEGIHNDTEYTLITSEGRKFPANVSTSLMKNATGKTLGLVIVVRDITERKKAEEKIKESEEKFSTLYSSMTEGVAIHEIIFDNSGIPVDYLIMDVNPAFEQITGLQKNNAIGKKASELYGTNKPPYFEIYKNVAITGIPESFETYFKPMDKHFRISVFSPGIGKFATVFQDISERKRNEVELLRVHERLELAQQSSGAGIWDWDIITGKLDWSFQLKKIFGLDPLKTEVSFDLWRKILYSEDVKDAEMKIELAVKNHELLENEYRIVHPTGEIRWISALGNTVYDNNGNALRMSGICIDITEKKKIEEMMRESEKRIKIAEAVQIELRGNRKRGDARAVGLRGTLRPVLRRHQGQRAI